MAERSLPSSPSASSSTSTSNTLSSPSLDERKTGRCSTLDLHHLPNDKPVFSCQKCSEALQDELVSKAFNGRSGQAYLMNSTINTSLGRREDRRLMTGMHTVADLLCASCNVSLGWMYIKAPNGEQRYKEGRYIIEAAKVVKENNW